MLAKLINGQISYAPSSLYVNGILTLNASDSLLKSLGYKEVIENDPPEEMVEGYLYVCSWVETENGIEQVYTLVKEPEKSKEELALEFAESQINTIEISTEKSLYYTELYPDWVDLCNEGYVAEKAGFIFKYYAKMDSATLYKTLQDNFTFQDTWIPGEGTSAIYTQISLLGTAVAAEEVGTIDNPIDVPEDVSTNAFTYVVGKYYYWDGVVYKCTRSGDEDGTEYSFVYSPDQLIGNYFEVIG